MTKEIIYTEHYALIVSDEQIKDVRPYKGKFHLEKSYIINQFPTYLTDLSECKLIIAHRPLTDAPIIEGVPLLPEFGDEDDTVDNLVKDYITEEIRPYLDRNPNQHYRIGIYGGSDVGFRKGYNKAKETYKYTEEDIKKAFIAGEERIINKPNSSELDDFTNFIQSLQQPKRPKYFESEIEQLSSNESFGLDYGSSNLKPKTIINSQNQTELVGKYIF